MERITEINATFPAGPPLTEDQQVGREREIAQLEHRLRAGEVISIFEGRRIGKTSIAGAALDRIATTGGRVAAVTLTRFGDPAHASEFLARQLQSSGQQSARSIAAFIDWLQRARGIDPLGSEAAADLGIAADLVKPLTAEERHLPNLLTNASRSKRTTALLLDEAHVIARWPAATRQALNVVLRENRDVGVVIASSEQSALEELSNKGGPLHLAGARFHLPDIAREAWTRAISRGFERLSIAIQPEDVETIVDETGGQPYLTMRLARDTARLASLTSPSETRVQTALLMQALFELRRDPVWKELR